MNGIKSIFEIRTLLRWMATTAWVIALLIITYYINVPMDLKALLTYLKAKPLAGVGQ
jgi:hypothetical protein